MAKKKKQKKAVNFDVLEQIQPNAAGIDIGVEEVYICVPAGRDEERVQSYATFTP